MFITLLLFIVGLICLIKGGDWLVDSACSIAKSLGIPDLIIGATIVSIGTTLPEIIVSTQSAITGHGEIAFGNALGSIICNTSLIAALSIIIKPAHIKKENLKLPVIFFFIAALLFSYRAYFYGYFTRLSGIVFLIIFLLYLFYIIRQEKVNLNINTKEEVERSNLAIEIAIFILGAVAIALGSNLLINNGIIIAEYLEVPEKVIGITMIALGTSLPELITAITSLRKGHGLLSLGNIIGANFFNFVLVTGLSVSLSPFAIPMTQTLIGKNVSLIIDIPVMLITMLILTIPALISGKLTRLQGIILLLLYISFIVFQFI